MKYTTTERLARRLRGRLEIKNQPTIDTALTDALGYGSVVSGQVVDPELIVDTAEIKESYIDLILSQIYVTPLSLKHEVTISILRDISECLIISSLMQSHFEGTNPVLQASDVSQASMDIRRSAEFLLQAISAGHNIWIPTIPGMDQSTPQGQRQPLRLPGEKLLGSNALPDTISRNYTVAAKKDLSPTSKRVGFFNDDTSDCGPCNSNRVYGREPYRRCT